MHHWVFKDLNALVHPMGNTIPLERCSGATLLMDSALLGAVKEELVEV